MHKLAIEMYDRDVEIPLHYQGTKLTFESAVPTEIELNTLPHLTLTSNTQWNPGEVTLGQAQSKRTNVNLKKVSVHVDDSGFITIDKYMYSTNMAYDDVQMHEMNPIARAL